MSTREAHESRPQQAEKAHESSDKQSHQLAQFAAHELTNPSSSRPPASQAGEAGLQKDFGNHKSFDFNAVSCPYGDRASQQKSGSGVESKPAGGANAAKDGPAHTATDGSAHTATDGMISSSTGDPNMKPQGETKPAFSSQRPDFSNKPEQGETKPGTFGSQKPDFSNKPENNYSDGKKQNTDAVASAQYDKSKELGRKEYDNKPAAAGKSSDMDPVVPPILDTPPYAKPADNKPAASQPADSKPADSKNPAGDQSSWSPIKSIEDAIHTWTQGIASIVEPG